MCGLLLQVHSNAAAYYFNNFEDPTLNGQSLSYWVGSPGIPTDWTTTDTHQSDGVLSSGPLAPVFGTQMAAIGGLYNAPQVNPSANHVELWVPLNQTDVTFSVKMDLQASTNGHNDAFGWTFRDTSGSELFNIMFTPQSQAAGAFYDISYTGWQSGDTVWSVSPNGAFQLDVVTNLASGRFWAQTQDATGGVNFSGVGATGSDLGSIAATWDVTSLDLTQRGDNAMLFDSYSVDVVPEPSTVLLTLTGLGALAFWQRNRKRA